ncbi:unnamed protein product, partial [Laminaria digitata]
KTEDGRFWTAAATAIVRVALSNGSGHEDVGNAHLKDRDKGEVLERVKKAAVTDATKRALRLFGTHLGGAMFNKEGLKDVERNHKQYQRELKANLQSEARERAAQQQPQLPQPPPQQQQPQLPTQQQQPQQQQQQHPPPRPQQQQQHQQQQRQQQQRQQQQQQQLEDPPRFDHNGTPPQQPPPGATSGARAFSPRPLPLPRASAPQMLPGFIGSSSGSGGSGGGSGGGVRTPLRAGQPAASAAAAAAAVVSASSSAAPARAGRGVLSESSPNQTNLGRSGNGGCGGAGMPVFDPVAGVGDAACGGGGLCAAPRLEALASPPMTTAIGAGVMGDGGGTDGVAAAMGGSGGGDEFDMSQVGDDFESAFLEIDTAIQRHTTSSLSGGSADGNACGGPTDTNLAAAGAGFGGPVRGVDCGGGGVGVGGG